MLIDAFCSSTSLLATVKTCVSFYNKVTGQKVATFQMSYLFFLNVDGVKSLCKGKCMCTVKHFSTIRKHQRKVWRI